MNRHSRSLWAAAIAVLTALASGSAQAQAPATVNGRVVDAQSNTPIIGAQVRVVNTNLGAVTGDDGRYVIRSVTPGAIDIRVARIGFAEQRRTVNVESGATAVADFALSRVAIQLAEVVSTATGEQRRVEIANAVTTVPVAKVAETGAIQNVGEVLNSRVAGVQVLQGGLVGAGTRVRIRGTSSLSLSNEPIYIVDGVRIESGVASLTPNIGTGGTVPSRVNDLNPDEIETMEVVRGPSAATLYGTDAANGVIVITTKRGRVGAPQWTFYGEEGVVQDKNDYPDAYTSYGVRTGSAASRSGCYAALIGAGTCTKLDSVKSYNITKDKDATPFTDGHRRQYGAQVGGGNQAVRYFVSGEFENVDGTYKIPNFDARRLKADGIKILDEWNNPSALARKSGRTNVDIALSPEADLGVHLGFTQALYRFPQVDNNITGLGYNLLNGPGRKDANMGYTLFTPGDIFQEILEQRINRFTIGAAPQYRPFTWLTARGNAGLDYTSRNDNDLCRVSTCADFGTTREGYKENDRGEFFQYSVDGNASANFQLTPVITSRTTVGAQYLGTNIARNGAGTNGLVPGGSTVTQGATHNSDEATTVSRTLGFFGEEMVSWQERLFVTGALRTDKSTAFGINFGNVVYPKASISYVLSDEPFFPKMGWLDQLRLRSAYGSSGVRPGTTDALPYYESSSVSVDGAELPSLVFSALGNLDLKPEKSTEFEGGLDMTLFHSRANVELTYYNKVSKDALISRIIPPSFGTGLTSRFENLGKVKNNGFEWLVNAQLVDLPMVGFDMSVNGSQNSNELVTLGKDIPPIVGTTVQQREGYPLNGYWSRPYTYNDANKDGIISASEVTVADSAKFLGYSQPRLEMGITGGLDVWHKVFRIQATVDHKGGNKLYNNSERFRCGSGNCYDLNAVKAPLDLQARAVAGRFEGAKNTFAGYIEDATFTRLRELSLTVRAPESWAGMLRSRSLSATVTGHNLALWTNYTGIDPESSYGQTDVPQDFLTQAPLRTWALRINVGL